MYVIHRIKICLMPRRWPLNYFEWYQNVYPSKSYHVYFLQYFLPMVGICFVCVILFVGHEVLIMMMMTWIKYQLQPKLKSIGILSVGICFFCHGGGGDDDDAPVHQWWWCWRWCSWGNLFQRRRNPTNECWRGQVKRLQFPSYTAKHLWIKFLKIPYQSF